MSVEFYHTKHGTRYCVRYRIAGKSTDKRGFALKRDAEAWEMQQLLHPQTTSLYHGPHRTVDQLFEEAVKRNNRALKPSWLQTVESKYRMHVQPEFGRLPAHTVTREHIEQWVNRLVKIYAPAIIRNTVGVLRTCLRLAVNEAIRPLTVGRDQNGWLFLSAGGRHPHYQTYIPDDPRRANWWTRAVDESAVSHVTPHDLRHTSASIAVRLGASVLVVQRMLGHSSAAMTLDVYADLFDSDLDDVRGRMDSAADETMQEKCGQNVGKNKTGTTREASRQNVSQRLRD